MSARPKPLDLGVAAWSLLFLGWLLLDWGGPTLAPMADLVLFAGIAGATVVALGGIAVRLPPGRDRLAWALLAASALSRLVSGSIWGLYVELSGATQEPTWLTLLGFGYAIFAIAGLLAFPSARLDATDRVRSRLDLSIALIGSLLLVWYFAIGPMLRAEEGIGGAPGAALNTLGDALAVILASALYLRADSRPTRLAAGYLLGAFLLQVVPDIGFWQLDWYEDYRAGDPIAAIWYGAWLFKWLAARAAHRALDAPASRPAPAAGPYRSGAIPHLFLIAATLLLLGKLATGNAEDRALFTVGSAVLTALLVLRQGVELHERQRLHQALRDEEGRFRALLQHAFDAVLVLDDGMVIRYAGPATERMLGIEPGITQPRSLAEHLHPSDLESVRAALRTIAEGPRAITVRLRDAAGETRILTGTLQDARAHPLIGGVVFNAHDRTRAERLAGGLRDAQQFEALGVLASGLAHDLNNILTVVASHVELLRDDQSLDASARSDLDAIGTASDRARSLTLGLLALSRRKRSPGRSLALTPFVREFAARRPGVRLGTPGDTSAEMTALAVRSDHDALAQVLDATLDEARAMRTDAGPVVMRTAAREVGATDPDALHLDPGSYATIEMGAQFDGAPDRIELPVSSTDAGDWDLAPSDLAMLMALAATREVGGTLVREHRGAESRMTILLPRAEA